MDVHDQRLKRIWRQKDIPIVFRRQRPEAILVKLPYSESNYAWLRANHRRRPKWNQQFKCWEVPMSWLDDVVGRTLMKFGKSYLIQQYRKHQKCAPACWNAQGYECECSCMGENHGNGAPSGNWREVSETFAFSYGPREYACRLLQN